VHSFIFSFSPAVVRFAGSYIPQVIALLTLRIVEDSPRLSDLFLEEFSLPARVSDALCNVGTHNGMWVWWGDRTGCVVYMAKGEKRKEGEEDEAALV
jgi:hypothetical protein